jgi:putative PEP-CTERM system TPR-repeat lipoprotein
VLLARQYLEQRDLPRALAAAREAQAAHPRNAAVLDVLGSVQLAMNDKDAALTTYSTIVSQNPNSHVAHYRLGLLQVDMRNYAGARQSFSKALELQPRYVPAKIGLAALEISTGRYPDALKLAQQIRSDEPRNPAAFILEAEVRTAQKDPAGAAKAYSASLEMARNSAVFIKMHQALRSAGNTKEADARTAQWLKESPDDVAVRMYLAEVEMAAGRTQAASEHYEAVLVKQPDNISVLNNLAWLYQERRDPRALATIERAYKLYPSDPTIVDTLGWIVLQAGDYKRAIPLLEEAVAKVPKSRSTTPRYHLAVGYVKSGQKAKARETLDALLASNETFPERAEVIALRAQL